jgi:hypothetical protein
VADTHAGRMLKLDSNIEAPQDVHSVSDLTAAICVSVKGENPGDLAEWVQYHRHAPISVRNARCSKHLQPWLWSFGRSNGALSDFCSDAVRPGPYRRSR